MNTTGVRGPAIDAKERDAIVEALGHRPKSDVILGVATRFNRGVSTVLRLQRAANL